MFTPSDLVNGLADWIASRWTELLSVFRVDVRRRTVTHDAGTGRTKTTEFALRLGDRDQPRLDGPTGRG